MNHFIVSPHAADDMDGIRLSLAEEASEEVADGALRRLARSFRGTGGDSRPRPSPSDLTRLPVHFLLVEPYMVVYARDRSTLAIHAVLHGSRDLRRILRGRPL